MRAPANPPAKPLGRLALIFVALMLATVSMTAPAKADEPSGDAPEASGQLSMDMPLSAVLDGERAAGDAGSGQDGDDLAPQGAGLASGDAPTLASYLSGGMLRVSADVALVDGDDEAIEPVVGSFTVDGLTYAIVGEGQVALVAASPRTLAGELVGGPAADPGDGTAFGSAGALSGEDSGSGVPTSPSPSPEGASSDDAEGADAGGSTSLALPEAVSYDGADYSLTAIGPRALAGCDAATVALPASVAAVDQAAFEGSPVAAIEVAEGNPEYSSYDGMLFDADMTSLLLIPEGKQGAARLPSTAEEVDPSRFSHSAGVSSISVDAGCAAYLSRNGCLYDASGETLLRVPPGIADVEVVDGCRALGPRALEGCASLRSIAAPATVTDVSPDASAPDPSAVTVSIPKVTPREVWEARGFSVEGGFSIEERKGAGERPSEGLAAEEPDDIPLAALGAAQVSNGGPSTVTLRTGLGRSDINDDFCYFEEVINSASGSEEKDSVRPTVSTYDGHYFIASGNKRFSYFRTAADKVAKRYCYATPYRYGAKAGAYDIYCGKDGTEDTGYDIAEGASNEWYNGPHKDHPNMTLQVKWVEAPKYTITLDHTGGTSSLANFKAWRGWEFSLETPSFSSKPIHDIETPSKTGYAFAGYFTGRDGTGTQYVDATGKIVVDSNDVKKSVTVYAHWVSASTVSFKANGGTGGQSAAVTAVKGQDMPAISTTAPTRTGYTFGGWYDTSASSGGTQYYTAEGKSARTWDKDGDATLYARWTANEYTVSFNANGGSGGQSANVTAIYDSAMPTISTAKPTRTGYAFQGWYDTSAASGGTQYYTAAGASARTWNKTSDATLYARWEAVPYGISYDCAGGELPEGARSSYAIEDAFDLPVPTRYGYQFDGWDVSGVVEGGAPGPVLGAGVEDATAPDGSKVTRVKAGTYGDLSCTARWTLRYDLDVPVCDPGSVTFEADSLTGQVRVAPGTSAEGAILSYMAVPVALDSLSCEGLGADGSPDPAGGAPELEAIFGAGSAAKVRFAATLGEGDAARTAKLTAGGSSATASLAGLSVPAAASHDAPGRIKVAYGLELDSDLAIPPVRDAAPVARLAYTVSLPGAGA